jgi:hypothetical protein
MLGFLRITSKAFSTKIACFAKKLQVHCSSLCVLCAKFLCELSGFKNVRRVESTSMMCFAMRISVFQFFSFLLFCLIEKSSKKIKAVEVILEIHNIFGRPTQTPHSFKNGVVVFYASILSLDIFKTVRQTGVALCPTMLGFLRITSKAFCTKIGSFAKSLKVLFWAKFLRELRGFKNVRLVESTSMMCFAKRIRVFQFFSFLLFCLIKKVAKKSRHRALE